MSDSVSPQQAVKPDAMEAMWQDMERKAAEIRSPFILASE
jgi:hypothetical protein